MSAAKFPSWRYYKLQDSRLAAEPKIAIAIQAREDMREHRKGKPIAFDPMWRPRV